MYFFFFASLLFLPALAEYWPQQIASPTAQSVIDSVISIHNAVLEQDATVQAHTGGSLLAAFVENTKIMAGIVKVHKANRHGFHRANFAATFSVEDSVRLIDTVVATGMSMQWKRWSYSAELTIGIVSVSIPNSIQHLREKRPVLKAGDTPEVVIASLRLLLSDHDSFSLAIEKKLHPYTPPKKLEQQTAASKNIHNVIQNALLYYTVGVDS